MKKAYLILENGDVYEGASIGAEGRDGGRGRVHHGHGLVHGNAHRPSYYGQIITQTFPLIGNYGAIDADAESDRPYCRGYIVRELCREGSNFRKEGELGDWLKDRGVVGIEGIDTRRLTKTIREKGVMNGMITPSLAHKEEKLAGDTRVPRDGRAPFHHDQRGRDAGQRTQGGAHRLRQKAEHRARAGRARLRSHGLTLHDDRRGDTRAFAARHHAVQRRRRPRGRHVRRSSRSRN